MALIGKVPLIVIGAMGTLYGVSMADRSINYIETDAIVTKAEVDCFVKSGRSHIESKATKKMAYMDCEMAPLAAAEFGYKNSDIGKRTKFSYTYLSPVDGSHQKGEHESQNTQYKTGQKFKIYAHKENPGESRF